MNGQMTLNFDKSILKFLTGGEAELNSMVTVKGENRGLIFMACSHP
jgi:hypothetical protein